MFWTRFIALILATTATQTSIAASPPQAERAPAESERQTAGARCPTVVHAGLGVDGGNLGGEGRDVTADRVRQRLTSMLRQWDVRPPRDDHDPVLQVALSSLPNYAGYRLTIRVSRGDEELTALAGSAECRLCTEDEFVDQVEERVEGTLERLLGAMAPEPEPAEPVAPTEAVALVPTPPPPVVVSPPRWELQARKDVVMLHRAGLGLGIAGAALVGLGVAWIGTYPLLPDDGDTSARQLWVAGTATAAAGTAALVSGIVLLVVARRRGFMRPSSSTAHRSSQR